MDKNGKAMEVKYLESSGETVISSMLNCVVRSADLVEVDDEEWDGGGDGEDEAGK